MYLQCGNKPCRFHVSCTFEMLGCNTISPDSPSETKAEYVSRSCSQNWDVARQVGEVLHLQKSSINQRSKIVTRHDCFSLQILEHTCDNVSPHPTLTSLCERHHSRSLHQSFISYLDRNMLFELGLWKYTVVVLFSGALLYYWLSSVPNAGHRTWWLEGKNHGT